MMSGRPLIATTISFCILLTYRAGAGGGNFPGAGATAACAGGSGGIAEAVAGLLGLTLTNVIELSNCVDVQRFTSERIP